MTVVKLEPICHTALREWLSPTAFWQDSNVSYLLGMSEIRAGYCMAAHTFTLCPLECVGVRGSLFEVILSLCLRVCLCVRGREGVGARPRPDS